MPLTAEDLLAVELFKDLPPAQRERIASWFEPEEVTPGVRVTHEDADGYVFFVLREGAADVVIDGRVVRTLGPGDVFGEISMLHGTRQTATVKMTAPGVLWRMFGTHFREMQQQAPQLLAELEELANRRADGPLRGDARA